MDAACRAAYEADILFHIIAEAKRHCAWLCSSSQMQHRCRSDVETLVLGNRSFFIAFVEWFWLIVATFVILFVAIAFRTQTLRLLKSTVTSVAYLLFAFVLLIVGVKGHATKIVSGGVVFRSTYDAVVDALENRLSEREKQLEDCRNALKRSNDTLESTNRSFADLDDRIVQLKKENEHFKQLLNAEKQKNRRHSN